MENTTSRQSEVSEQMELLSKGIGSLQEVIGLLEQRLTKVVRSPSPVEAAYKDNERTEPSVSLAIDLATRVSELRRMKVVMHDLLERVEL